MRHLFVIGLLIIARGSLFAGDSVQFKLKAGLDIYWGYQFNKPFLNQNAAFIYNHNRHNELNLNLGYAGFSAQSENYRGNLVMMAGTYVVSNLTAEPPGLKNVMEANAGVRLLRKKELWLDAGILPSHIGFESAIGTDNPTLTRNVLADNTPYFETGARLSYQPNKNWSFSAFYLNGWQNITKPQGLTKPSFGSQITYKTKNNITINHSFFTGYVPFNGGQLSRSYHNFFIQTDAEKKTVITAGFDCGIQDQRKWYRLNSWNRWNAAVLVIRQHIRPKLWFGGRAEYYLDRDGILLSNGIFSDYQILGYSVNLDYLFSDHVQIRTEFRTMKNQRENGFYRHTPTDYTSNNSWFTAAIQWKL